MNTPAHLVLGLAAFGRAHRRALIAASLAGALLPDLSLYLLSGWELLRGTPPRTIFRDLYYSDAWQAIFAVDNSIPLWTSVALAGAAMRRPWVVALGGAALLHLVLDLLLHHDDARRHFWPLSDWVFVSPVSYWDPAHGGHVVGPLETAVTLGLCLHLWWRHAGDAPVRILVVMLAIAQLAPAVMWGVVLG